MELVSIEQSRLISLFEATRPSGQLYLPEAAGALVERYSFVEVPQNLIGVDTLEFKHGKFQDSAIEALSIYKDGVIIVSRSNTKLLEDFYADLIDWIGKTFGVIRIETKSVPHTFDSSLVVAANTDLLRLVRNAAKIGKLVSEKLEATPGIKTEFEPVGLHFGPDVTTLSGEDLKPNLFRVERRTAIPFGQNRFFSTAPLRTDDHLEVLAALEGLI